MVGLAVVSCGFQLDGFSHGVLEAREGVRGSRFLDTVYGCSTVVLIGFTCPAITVGTTGEVSNR